MSGLKWLIRFYLALSIAYVGMGIVAVALFVQALNQSKAWRSRRCHRCCGIRCRDCRFSYSRGLWAMAALANRLVGLAWTLCMVLALFHSSCSGGGGYPGRNPR